MIRKKLGDWRTAVSKDPIRIARVLTARAIRKKRLMKPTTCEMCGKQPLVKRLHAHHNEYDRWWDVTWLCGHCHKAVHLKGMNVHCQRCNKQFYVPLWRLNINKGKYCSVKCYRKVTNGGVSISNISKQ